MLFIGWADFFTSVLGGSTFFGEFYMSLRSVVYGNMSLRGRSTTSEGEVLGPWKGVEVEG